MTNDCKFAVVDAQHRLAALLKLKQQGWEFLPAKVDIFVYLSFTVPIRSQMFPALLPKKKVEYCVMFPVSEEVLQED